MSQQELGERIGISQPRVSRYENGDRFPKLDKLLEIARALNATVDDILIEAGMLLPPEDQTVRELWDVARHLNPDEFERVKGYARWRLREQQEGYQAGDR